MLTNMFSLEFVNHCPQPVWPAMTANAPWQSGINPMTDNSALQLGDTRLVSLPLPWSGRLWGKQLCAEDGTNCSIGDCGNQSSCWHSSGSYATLFEFDASTDAIAYDISLVDALTLGMKIIPENPACFPVECDIPAYVGLGAKKKPLCPRMGRKKLVIEEIKEPRRRRVTFVKRKRGILKKARELAVLTGSAVTLSIHNENLVERHSFGGSGEVQIEEPINASQSASSDDAGLQDWPVDKALPRSDAHATSLEPGSSSATDELVPWQPVKLYNEEMILAASLPGSDALSVDASHLLALQNLSASNGWMQQFPSQGQDMLGWLFHDSEWQQYCAQYLGQDGAEFRF
ncbi:hypothetical protein MY11210_009051 [Beauveria gryllotalpidicola]